jgi:hypothetical protein
MRAARMADIRNVYRPKDVPALGFEYVAVGRRSESAGAASAEEHFALAIV